MRLCLGIIFTNELHWLKLHLPVYKDSFDGIVAITDPATTDGSIEYLHSLGAAVIQYPWEYHWGDFANKLCGYAESLGYDAICRIDPDECLFPWTGTEIKLFLQRDATLLCLPRYNFFNDRKHLWEGHYPDHQMRAWRLHRGIVVSGAKHEGVNVAAHELNADATDPDHRAVWLSNPHIYHYGWASKGGIYYQQTKYQSQAQVAAGGPPQVAWPADFQIVQYPTVPFDGAQPQNPDMVGLYAPYES